MAMFPKKEFQQWEQATGISFSPHALLANPALRPILRPTRQNCWDWMHCLLSNGVMNMALFNVLDKLDQWDLLSSYVQHFHLPKSLSNIKLGPLFQSKRLAKDRKHKKIIATASETFDFVQHCCTLYESGVSPSQCMQRRSRGLLCQSCASWTCFKPLGMVQWFPWQLLEAAESSLKQCVDLDWKLIKKHNWLLHFHQMLSQAPMYSQYLLYGEKEQDARKNCNIDSELEQFRMVCVL